MRIPPAVTDAAPGPPADIAGALSQAIDLLASDPSRAEAAARQILTDSPGNPDALVVLGTALRVQGRFDAARQVFEPLAAAAAGSWVAHYELGQALFGLGRTREAAAPLARAVAINRGLAPCWRLLGDILMVSGEVAAAQAAYARRLGALAGDPRLRGAADALADGRPGLAERDLRSALAREPSSLPAAHLLGEALAQQGRIADAERLLAQCAERAPASAPIGQSYALALMRGGRFGEALTQLDRLLAGDTRDHRSRMMKAAALTETGDYAAAAAVTAALLGDFPDQPRGWLVHGAGLRTLGRIEEAIGAWRKCLELDPDCSEATWSLANLKTFRFTADELAAIETRLAGPDLGAEDRANLLFTLGKAREDAGAWALAFESYARANAIERARRPYDADATTDLVRRLKALVTPAFLAQRAHWGLEAKDPIFIVGLPRSGSTLVEQILASHPQVEGTRELADIQVIADWIGGPPADGRRPGYPDRLATLPAEAFAKFGRDYLGWTRAHRRLGRDRFIDKTPGNFFHAGLIHLILPGARIIDVRRHPLACCLSAFRQHFSQGWHFSYDLNDLGRYYADYVDLIEHYDQVLPGKIHRVIYEDLVADTEGQVRRLLDYLELPFDPACLEFFDNRRPVATPSSEQVRQPIFADAIHRWRAFEPWLGPLKAALGRALDAYPSAPPRTGGR